MDSEASTLVLILGPTGVGKSRTGLRLAEIFDGEIINCDSMQVYKGFDIGTDKPSPEDRRAVRHHLIDVVSPTQQFTAADFVARALDAIQDIRGRNRLPILVGGTGLYIRALVDGLFPGPGGDPALRRALEEEAAEKGLGELFNRLSAVDPDYARKIRGRDRIRIIRALEVYQKTGQPMSRHFLATSSPVKDFHLLEIGLKLDRRALYERIESRVDRMFERGLVAEVGGLLSQGVPETAPAFRALGYGHVLRVIKGELGEEEARALTKLETRHYAKRQMTWFRKMADIMWFSADDAAALEAHLKAHLRA